MKKTNMYRLSKKQWNPFVGCQHHCTYCESSFQAQLKRWAKGNCEKCYNFEPHCHPTRLTGPLRQTGYMQFIFTCAHGDIAFCPTWFLQKIIQRINKEPHKTFLIQSKNPRTFKRVKFPRNVILGTTIETNRDTLYEGISKAPPPSKRFRDFLEVQHKTKMVTIEPVIDFQLHIMIAWIKTLNPCMIWLGYDSKNNQLPEPSLSQVQQLYWELGKRGYTVILKTIRKAWWEKP